MQWLQQIDIKKNSKPYQICLLSHAVAIVTRTSEPPCKHENNVNLFVVVLEKKIK
jgi:hypothetical protein